MSSNRSQAEFETAVRTAKSHIAAGDVFQLVISQRLEAQVPQSPLGALPQPADGESLALYGLLRFR